MYSRLAHHLLPLGPGLISSPQFNTVLGMTFAVEAAHAVQPSLRL